MKSGSPLDGAVKHTAGPWRLWHQGNTLAVYGKNQPFGEHPCVVTWGGFDGCDLPLKKQIANATLISAAPDLLAAAKHVLAILDHPTRSVSMLDADKLRDAIAKAETLVP